MEVVQRSTVGMPNSDIVNVITDIEADKELYDILKQYGSIQMKIPVAPPLCKQVIIEYVYGTAEQSLSHLLPYRLCSKTIAHWSLRHCYIPLAN